ncbi:hypothetical protein GUITHDRAFT_116245 [Guillardia theta CCMP2712]|uniref:Uncharacterized protein n=1 Tax=Guillardia theta (strain CCMP2712) TaxID=905079 RepID=L1INY3_GUITC|nr:hypothetical protein GUITHDRAFT_116245 [Guillardia theta CCMP2712]EKX37604.1 hypothetical protein GUITHDRAFT_116245 [Guillardia theta CCMP2712]|eukprot:XP_005824584.1 hypothetical protein GUITHDRAFT_116245 [Guillardia theta CCMP2712]
MILASSCLAIPLKKGRRHEVDSKKAGDVGFDYMHLVQEWPGSFCDTKKGCTWPKVEPTTGWLLHGLWPEFFNGSWPQYCDKGGRSYETAPTQDAPFNMSAIQDLLPELEKYWPSLVAPDQSSFWEHEWLRHGTCAEKIFTAPQKEHAYFRLVLDLREKFDVFKFLSAAGINPGDTTTWAEAKEAMKKGYPYEVELGCNTDAQGSLQIFEVRSCYTATPGGGVSLFNCPNAASATSCGTPNTPITFPPFHGR